MKYLLSIFFGLAGLALLVLHTKYLYILYDYRVATIAIVFLLFLKSALYIVLCSFAAWVIRQKIKHLTRSWFLAILVSLILFLFVSILLMFGGPPGLPPMGQFIYIHYFNRLIVDGLPIGIALLILTQIPRTQ